MFGREKERSLNRQLTLIQDRENKLKAQEQESNKLLEKKKKQYSKNSLLNGLETGYQDKLG